jgi:hypothetical protein
LITEPGGWKSTAVSVRSMAQSRGSLDGSPVAGSLRHASGNEAAASTSPSGRARTIAPVGRASQR